MIGDPDASGPHPELVAFACATAQLPLSGIHGLDHWARVRSNGLRLAPLTGADPQVVELFAFLHDVFRLNDGHDPEHGPRAAKAAPALAGRFALSRTQVAAVQAACAGHTRGGTHAEPTIATCWDADRLDLGRVGVTPDPDLLCTAAARDLIPWSHARAQALLIPRWMQPSG